MCIVKLKISSYEINDAVMASHKSDTVSIPCDSDTDFACSLMAGTSIQVFLQL